MKINQGAFRLYDIRGIYPQDLNEKIAYQIGRAFCRLLNKKKKMKIALGQDVRLSSPLLFKGFSDGVRDEGHDIIDLGTITTPALYFAVLNLKCDGGAVITASHNPNPFNGIKLVREKAIPISGETGIFQMRDLLIKEQFSRDSVSKKRGKITKKDINKSYLGFVLKKFPFKKGDFKDFSLAVDAGNGSGGPLVLDLLSKLGVKTYPIYCNPDGSFPNHVPDPIVPENLKDIIALGKKKKVDLSVALDGDADRIVFVDEKQNPVRGDLVTAFLATVLLRENRGAKVLYDVRSSNIVKEKISEAGGKPVASRIGHALIKEKMRKEDIIFGGEFSGHYYWGGNLFFEVPLLVLVKILKEMKERQLPLSELIKPFKKYFHSGEINFVVKNKEKKIKRLKEAYLEGKISEIDGLRIDFDDWWFLVRASNTEPTLRLVAEAKTKELLEAKTKELRGHITGEAK